MSRRSAAQEPIRTPDDLVSLGKRVRQYGITGLKTNMITFERSGSVVRHMPGFAAGPGWPELNPPDRLLGQVRDQLLAMREGSGTDMQIRLDLNFNFRPEGYRLMTRGLDDLGLAWIEIDPLRSGGACRDPRAGVNSHRFL